MTPLFGRSWWGLALRGLLAILFGIAVFILPGISLLALVSLFGAYALVDGVFALISAFRIRAGHQRWWALLLEGIVGIAVGLLTFFFPGITAISLVYVIAAWAILTGVLEVVVAIRFREELDNEWLLALGGLLSIAAGILLGIQPQVGAIALVWLIGAYAIVFGVLMVVAGLRARRYADMETPTLRPA